MTLKPLKDNIVVWPDPKKSLSSVIYAPLDEDTHTGTVLAVGPGKWLTETVREAIDLSPGDRVRYTGQFATTVGDELLMSWSSVIGVLEPANG